METWFWILGWSLSISTVTGNGFIIFLVCSKRQLRTKTNAFVVSLAVADLCIGMSVIPPRFFCEMAKECNHTNILFIDSVRLLFSFSSVMNLCGLVVDRYIAVVKPFKYLTFTKRRRVIQIIFLSWAIPLVHGIGIYLNWFIFENPRVWYLLTWVAMFLELFPCFFLIVSFASMLQVICRHERAARTRARQLRFNHHRISFKIQEKSAIKIMAIVIGMFLLCYGFYVHCSFERFLLKKKRCNYEEYKIPLLVLNSAINPVAYAFFKRDINKEIKRRIFCVICKA